MTDSLGFALPREMARVRDEIMPAYIEIGPAGYFALTMMRSALDRATKALATQDVAAMVACYEELKGFDL